MTEQKKPAAGEWWFANDGSRVFICGHTDSGKVIFQGCKHSPLMIDLNGWSGWHHEPRCTGWDWVVPFELSEFSPECKEQLREIVGVPSPVACVAPFGEAMTEPANRVAVRLWVVPRTGEMLCSESQLHTVDKEIFHDANGFFIERGEP